MKNQSTITLILTMLYASMLVIVPMILVIGCLVLYDKKKPFLPGCLLSLITVIILFATIRLPSGCATTRTAAISDPIYFTVTI